jgi:hypothetical protein
MALLSANRQRGADPRVPALDDDCEQQSRLDGSHGNSGHLEFSDL